MKTTSRSKTTLAALAIATLLTAAPAVAQSGWLDSASLAGSLTADLRYFTQNARSGAQVDGDQPSFVLAPEWQWRSEDRRHQVKLAPFYRLDGEDDERTHFDLREGFYRYAGNGWDLTAGVNRVFWGVAESRHLVDVINQTDAVEDIDEEDKLGQPMLQAGWTTGWGRFEVLALLGFRERTFPGSDGRLRAPLVVDTERALYESGAGDHRLDAAIRWSDFLGDWDVGAHVFYGTSREPRLLPAPSTDGGGDPVLVPFYDVVSQVGVDVQYTRGAWLWKLEALAREGQGDRFGAAVAGFERTLYQLRGSTADLGLIVELHWDGRDETAPRVIYDEDFFLGARLAFNDIDDTSVLLGGLIDEEDGSTAIFLEAERRLTPKITLEIEGRFFVSADPSIELAAVARDDVVAVRTSWNL